jgi:hypothetical protein
MRANLEFNWFRVDFWRMHGLLSLEAAWDRPQGCTWKRTAADCGTRRRGQNGDSVSRGGEEHRIIGQINIGTGAVWWMHLMLHGEKQVSICLQEPSQKWIPKKEPFKTLHWEEKPEWWKLKAGSYRWLLLLGVAMWNVNQSEGKQRKRCDALSLYLLWRFLSFEMFSRRTSRKLLTRFSSNSECILEVIKFLVITNVYTSSSEPLVCYIRFCELQWNICILLWLRLLSHSLNDINLCLNSLLKLHWNCFFPFTRHAQEKRKRRSLGHQKMTKCLVLHYFYALFTQGAKIIRGLFDVREVSGLALLRFSGDWWLLYWHIL